MNARQNKKPKLTAEAAYENAHLVAQDLVQRIGDPAVIKETLVQARRQAEDQIERVKAERGALWARLRDDHAELGRLAASLPSDPRLADANESGTLNAA